RLLRQALADRSQNTLQAAARRIGLTHTKPHVSLCSSTAMLGLGTPRPTISMHYSIPPAAPIWRDGGGLGGRVGRTPVAGGAGSLFRRRLSRRRGGWREGFGAAVAVGD